MTGTNYQRRRSPRKGGCLGCLLLALLLILVAAACHSSEQYKTSSGVAVHWQQNKVGSLERQIELVVPAQYASDGSFMRAMNHAVEQWNRTDYINMVLDSPATIPTQCDAGWHCIVATRKPMNGGVAYLSWDSYGHMGGLRRVEFDSAPWQQDVLNNAACHEVGHQMGLAHSTHDTPGPCQGTATDHDINLVNSSHAHSDPIFTGPATQQRAATHSLIIGHDRAFYERLTRAGR